MTDKPRRAMPTFEEARKILSDPEQIGNPRIAPDGSCDATELREWRALQCISGADDVREK